MASDMYTQFPCHIRASHGETYLTTFNQDVVSGLGSGQAWHFRLHGDSNYGSPQYILAKHDKENSGPLQVVTIDEASDEKHLILTNHNMGEPPKPTQLWTFEEAIMTKRFPPMGIARLQSVSNPNCSVGIGGNKPLPRLYMATSAMPNDEGNESQRWMIDFFMED